MSELCGQDLAVVWVSESDTVTCADAQVCTTVTHFLHCNADAMQAAVRLMQVEGIVDRLFVLNCMLSFKNTLSGSSHVAIFRRVQLLLSTKP